MRNEICRAVVAPDPLLSIVAPSGSGQSRAGKSGGQPEMKLLKLPFNLRLPSDKITFFCSFAVSTLIIDLIG